MFGLDLLTTGSLLVLAAGTAPACAMPEKARINILPDTKPVRYDFSRSLAELQGQAVDTINPYGFHDTTRTQGFMEGTVTMKPVVRIDYRFLPGYDAFCLWYDTIDVHLDIEPVIVIAREVYEDKCLREAVLEHEMKHVAADRQVVNKYAKVMGQKIYDALQQRGFVAGPVPQAQGQETADRMQNTVYQITDHEYKKMQLERTEKQQAIDSLAEYKRVSAKCAGAQKTWSYQTGKPR
jgi:hypothetical protein